MYRLKLNSLERHQINNIIVVDGDTIKADVLYKLSDDLTIVVNQRIRLARINAPEKNTSDGMMIKEWLTSYLADKENISIVSPKNDKYGRLLAEVFVDDKNLTNTIIDSFPTIHMIWRP